MNLIPAEVVTLNVLFGETEPLYVAAVTVRLTKLKSRPDPEMAVPLLAVAPNNAPAKILPDV